MKYKITEEIDLVGRPFYYIMVKGTFCWHIVKEFRDEDVEYARRCAEDVLEILEQEI